MNLSRKLVAGGLAAVLAVSLAACSSGEPASPITADAGDPVTGGTLTIADTAQPLSGFDPVLAQAFNAKRFASQFYESLLSLSADGTELEPGLATEWEQVSETEYTFTLREGVTFHDGSAMTADDVVFSLQRVVDPATSSPYANLYSIDTVSANDAGQVVVTLTRPQASLLRLLAQPWSSAIVSEAWFTSKTPAEIKTQENGTGAFALESYQEGALISTVGYDGYWNAPLPYLDQVDYRLIPDESTLVQALTSGSVDMAQVQLPNNLKTLENAGIEVGDSTATGTQWMGVNTLSGPMSDINVRRAFSLALDREKIINVVTLGTGGYGGLIPSGDPLGCTMDADSPYYEHSVDKAKELLEESGLSDVTVSFKVGSNAATAIKAAQLMKEQVAEAGITLDIQVVPFETLVPTLLSEDWGADMIGLTSALNADPSQYAALWFAEGSTATKVDDQELWDLMETAQSENGTAEERKADYQEICDYVADNAYMFNGYAAPTTYDAWNSKVKNFTADVTNTRLFLKEAWLG